MITRFAENAAGEHGKHTAASEYEAVFLWDDGQVMNSCIQRISEKFSQKSHMGRIDFESVWV